MQIQINNVSIDVRPDDTLNTAIALFCEQQNINQQHLVLAHNDRVIPRSVWQTTAPHSHGCYTLFTAVAGG